MNTASASTIKVYARYGIDLAAIADLKL